MIALSIIETPSTETFFPELTSSERYESFRNSKLSTETVAPKPTVDPTLHRNIRIVLPGKKKLPPSTKRRERSSGSRVVEAMGRKLKPTLDENFENDANHAIQYTRWLLTILGIWPMVEKNSKKMEIHGSRVMMTICSILMGFIMIPSSLHMMFREKNPIVRLMLFGPIGFCLTNILKYCSIIFRRNSIKSCIEHLKTDWTTIRDDGDREIMKKNVNAGRELTAVCGIFMYTGGLSYHTIMPLWTGNRVNDVNETVRPLVYPGYDIFFDPQTSPNYEIIFYTNCLSACVTYTVTTAACNLAAIFVTHSCGQIQIVMSRLENLFDNVDDKHSRDDVVRNRVGCVIRYHVRVLRFTSMVERVLREICLVEVVASTLIICLLEYYCMTEWNNSETVAIITYFMLLISLSFNIFIFCHIGEMLKDHCYQVGVATYMTEWYRLPSKTGIALVMMIAMANYPRKITAGRMMELSVTSFGAIIKTSVMYLNMLRTIAD